MTLSEAPVTAPVIPDVNLLNLPTELLRHDHWVEWKYKFEPKARDPKKRWRKVPLIAGQGIGASTTDP
jgi:hypothetical protein